MIGNGGGRLVVPVVFLTGAVNLTELRNLTSFPGETLGVTDK